MANLARRKLLGIMTAAAALVGAVALAAHAQAQSSPQPAQQEPLRVRRVYVPVDRALEVVRQEKMPYDTMKIDELEKLLQSARLAAGGVPDEGAELVEAEFAARLEGDQLTGGQARLTIVHRGQGPVLLPLAPCRLPLADPAWNGPPVAPALTGLHGSDGLMVLVEKSGTLQFGWTLVGKRQGADSLDFDLDLPACPSKHLLIDLPIDRVPFVDHGVVLHDPEPVDGTRQRWRIELGGQTHVMLRIAAHSEASERRLLTLLRQVAAYDLSPRGLEVSAQLTLDIHNEPLRQLGVVLDAPLQLVSAKYGEKELNWVSATDSEPGQSRIVVQMPEPLQGSGRVVRLEALAPVVMDQSWMLPAIHPEGVFWEEGSTRLLVHAPLVLADISASGCRQTRAEPLPALESGELVELQDFAAQASIQVTMQKVSDQLMLREGVMIDVSGTKLDGRTIVDCSVSRTERFALSAQVAGDWIIDTVESIPAGDVSDWNVESVEGGGQSLAIRLAGALSPSQPRRLVITGRSRRSVLEERLTVRDCRMLRFNGANIQRSLMLLRTGSSYQLHISGGEQLTQLSPANLDAVDADLLDDEWTGMLLVLDAEADAKEIRLEDDKPRYASTVRVEITAEEDALAESYSFHCTPESARVEQLLVHFSQPGEQPPAWSMGEGGERSFAARQLTPDEQVAVGLGSRGETWEIVLRQPRSVAFDLVATRRVPFTKAVPLGLAALLEAASHAGTVTVRAADPASFLLRNNRLEPIPAEAASGDRYGIVRGTFRFEPLRDVLASSDPAVELVPTGGKPAPIALLLVWNSHVVSRYPENGPSSHLATFQLQNLGRRQVRVRLPDAARVEAVWVDDVQVQPPPARQEFAVDLPPGRKFPVLSIWFEQDGTSLGTLRRLVLPQPHLSDVPEVAINWTVWLPPGFELSGGGAQPARPALTWNQRLFGWLARSPARKPWQPFQPEQWVGLVKQSPSQRRAQGAARALVDRLSDVIQERSEATITWGAALTKSLESDGRLAQDASRLPVWVDCRALAEIGVTPTKSVPVQQGSDGRSAAFAALERAELVLLVHGRGLLLTSTAEAAHYRQQLAPLSRSDPWMMVLDGPLAQALQSGRRLPDFAPIQPAESWVVSPGEPDLPWLRSEQVAYDVAGWNATEIVAAQDGEISCYVADQRSIHAVSWAMLLLVASLVCWKLTRRPHVLVGLLAVLVVLALLLPPSLVPIVSGALLGMLAGGVVLLVRAPPGQRAEDQSSAEPTDTEETSEQTVVGAAAPWVLLCAAAIGLPQVVRAQSPASAPLPASSAPSPDVPGGGSSPDAPSPPVSTPPVVSSAEAPQIPVYTIFIPIDERRQPSDGTCFVPEALRQALQRRATAAGQQPRGWLITNAAYRVPVLVDATSRQWVVPNIEAIFDVHAFSQPVTVRLGLHREQLAEVPETALVDGHPTPLVWEADGQACLVKLPEAGDYRLALRLAPRAQTTAAEGGFDLAIPEVASARVEVLMPPGLAEVTVPTALGGLLRDREQRTVRGSLGAADTLAVRWLAAAGSSTAAAVVDSEELLWLKVQPGGVVVDFRMKLKVSEWPLRQLRLAADPRLRLLPLGEESVVGEAHVEPGQPQVIVLDLKEPVTERAVIDVQLLWTGTSGVGNLTLPQVQLLHPRTSRRTFAVSVDEALQFEETPGEDLQALTTVEFATAWGDSKTKPALAYRQLGDSANWTLATQPRKPRVEAHAKVAVTVDRQKTALWYRADVNVSGGYLFVHRLAIPPGMSIDGVVLYQGETLRGTRWSSSSDDTLNVFLTDGHIDGPHRLELRGSIELPDAGRLPLPRVELLTAEPGALEYEVFRQHDVRVEFEPRDALAASPAHAAVSPKSSSPARLVARSDAIPTEGTVLIVTPNNPRISPGSAMATRVIPRQGDLWQVEVDNYIEIEQGVLDAVRLSVPTWWAGPYEVDPPADVQVLDMPGAERKQLVIRPAAPIRDALRLRVSAPLSVGRGDRLRVPTVVPLGTERMEQYLLLPTQSGAQPIGWETEQLQPATLPPRFAGSQTQGGFAVYEIVGDGFQAALKSTGRAGRMPQVRLADLRVAWSPGGRCQGAATFDLEPAGLEQCVVTLPAGYRLLYATVAGLAAMPQPIGTDRWQLPLGPRHLPQRVELVFDGQVEAEGERPLVQFRGPVLSAGRHPMHVERTLWTVFSPPQAGAPVPTRGQFITPQRQELLRLTAMTSLVDLESETVATQTPEHLARWYRPWARRLLLVQDAIGREAASAAPIDVSGDEVAEAQTMMAEQEAVARRLGTGAVLGQFASRPVALVEAAELWQASVEVDRSSARAMFQGATPTLGILFSGPPDSGFSLRLVSALGCVILLAGVLLANHHVPWADLLWRWPHLLGCLIGLAWWLWLWPSFVGWVIVVLSLATMLRRPWHQTVPVSPDSTISRLRSPGGPA